MNYLRIYLHCYKMTALASLLFFTFRIYVSPASAPAIHSWLRDPIDQAFESVMLDELLWHWNLFLAGVGIANIILGAFLVKKITAQEYFEGCVFSLLGVSLPIFDFGYAMAHTDSYRIFAYSFGWFLTAALWFFQTILQILRKRRPPLN